MPRSAQLLRLRLGQAEKHRWHLDAAQADRQLGQQEAEEHPRYRQVRLQGRESIAGVPFDRSSSFEEIVEAPQGSKLEKGRTS